MAKDIDEIRRLLRECCEEAAAAGKVALRAMRTCEKVLASVENLRSRVATQEQLLRQSLRSAYGVIPPKNPEK
jgi:hypothetical protein